MAAVVPRAFGIDREPVGRYGSSSTDPRERSGNLFVGLDMDSLRQRSFESRPLLFLVTTTPAAGDIKNRLGSPAYSYYFAVEAFAPILEKLGRWRLTQQYRVVQLNQELCCAARKTQ